MTASVHTDLELQAAVQELKDALRGQYPERLHRATVQAQRLNSSDPRLFAALQEWDRTARQQLAKMEAQWERRQWPLCAASAVRLEITAQACERSGRPEEELKAAVADAEALAGGRPLQGPTLVHAGHAVALSRAQRVLRCAQWRADQPALRARLEESAAAALCTTRAGAGDPGQDASRAQARARLAEAVGAARAALADVPGALHGSEPHAQLVVGEGRAAEVQDQRPVWVPDAERGACHGCRRRLGWLRLVKRHHCRQCGEVFCWECTRQRKPLGALGYAGPKRVCARCFPAPCAAPPPPPLPSFLLDADGGAGQPRPLQPQGPGGPASQSWCPWPPRPPPQTPSPLPGHGPAVPPPPAQATPAAHAWAPAGQGVGYTAPAGLAGARPPPANPNWVPCAR